MALIACAECQQQISDKAPACPHCGAPREIAVAGELPATPPVTVTEQTGKSWKGVQLAGLALIMFGFVGCVANQGNMFPGIAACIAGIVVYVIGKTGGWWQHG
jgi:hypothetical protein